MASYVVALDSPLPSFEKWCSFPLYQVRASFTPHTMGVSRPSPPQVSTFFVLTGSLRSYNERMQCYPHHTSSFDPRRLLSKLKRGLFYRASPSPGHLELSFFRGLVQLVDALAGRGRGARGGHWRVLLHQGAGMCARAFVGFLASLSALAT